MPIRDIVRGIGSTVASAIRGVVRRPPRPGDADFVPWLIKLAIVAAVAVVCLWLVSLVVRAFVGLVLVGLFGVVVVVVIVSLFG